LQFAKRGKVRFISHRDVARAFERAFRIERLPLAFTAGFSPRPKVSFGFALSVGHESDAEYLDVELVEPVDVDALPARLSSALPEGIDVTGAAALVEHAPALQESITELEYRVDVTAGDDGALPVPALRAAVEQALACAALPVARTRKGRESIEDIRPHLRAATVAEHDGRTVLELALSTTEARSARPGEVLAAIAATGAVGLTEARVVRTRQWIERDGARLEPLDADTRVTREGIDVRSGPSRGRDERGAVTVG
jgi:radical SAM-linked protein